MPADQRSPKTADATKANTASRKLTLAASARFIGVLFHMFVPKGKTWDAAEARRFFGGLCLKIAEKYGGEPVTLLMDGDSSQKKWSKTPAAKELLASANVTLKLQPSRSPGTNFWGRLLLPHAVQGRLLPTPVLPTPRRTRTQRCEVRVDAHRCL